MKKRTIIAKLREQLDQEVKSCDLEVVGGGKITIIGGPGGTKAVNGDPDD